MIGIYDSTVAGLGLARGLARRFPDQGIIFLADTARAPFGCKHPRTVARFLARGLDYLVRRGARRLVVACPAASAVLDMLPPFSSPVFWVLDAVSASAGAAALSTKNRRVGVAAEPIHMQTQIFSRKIQDTNPDIRVFHASCSLLADFGFHGRLKKPETVMVAKKSLHPLKTRQVDTLILGAGLLGLFVPLIQRKIGPKVRLVDPLAPLEASVWQKLAEKGGTRRDETAGSEKRLLVTDASEAVVQTAARLFKNRPRLEQVDI